MLSLVKTEHHKLSFDGDWIQQMTMTSESLVLSYYFEFHDHLETDQIEELQIG